MKPVLIDPSLFEVTRSIEANRDVFAHELANLDEAELLDCPHTTLYNRGWRIYPLVMAYYPFPCDFDAHRRRCPESHALLSQFPQIGCAAFSRLLPGCNIVPHVDNPPPGQLRSHLAITTDDRVRFRILDRDVRWRQNEVLVFDTSMEHEVRHGGDEPRDILIADFVMTPDEESALAEWYGRQQPPESGPPSDVDQPTWSR